ncbi:DUF5642 family protein [Nocardia sp. alder85J]|nr:DUF5642 family protein [Nocardia sp. alder85J]MCX4094878.1 DUF5642 family protein [Nocardia sp. alder85J]
MLREVSRRRWGRVPGVIVLGVPVLGALGSACGSTVTGHPVPASSATSVQHVTGGLTALLPRPERFPPHYTIVVLPPEQARRAAGDLRGIPAGAEVEPAACAAPVPEFDAGRAAIEVGSDDEARVTVTVELVRTDEALARVRERTGRCALVRVRQGPLTTTVVSVPEPLPGVAADDAFALRRTVTGTRGGAGLTQSMHTRLAQIGDVRINVTCLTFGDELPDTGTLDQVFTAAVDGVRHG